MRNRKYGDTFKGRDVYNEQQLERQRLKPKQKGTGRYILAIVSGVLTSILIYLVWTLAVWGFAVGQAHGIGPTAHNAVNSSQTAKSGNRDNSSGTTDSGAYMIMHKDGQYWLESMDGSKLATNKYSDVNQVPIRLGQSIVNSSDYNLPLVDGHFEGTVGQLVQSKNGQGGNSNSQNANNSANQTSSAKANDKNQNAKGFGWFFTHPSMLQVMFSLAVGFALTAFLWEKVRHLLQAQNALSDTSDINQHMDDQHIMVPEEMMGKYVPFPNAGAHSWISVSSLISHTAISNKGLNPVKFTRRYKKDTYDENGQLIAYKGEAVLDNNGDIVQDSVPMIDEKFMDDLFTASGNPKDKSSRKRYDPRKLVLHPAELSTQKYLKKHNVKTVADWINYDWELPSYEMQRPGGVYWVDDGPVNTMVLAITRGGKGQTVIEPSLDMWCRSKRKDNIVVNDPKGELLCKFYVPSTYRGFQIVQFNLMNVLNTDIYNPLVLAAQAAREGDTTKCAAYVNNIADVFFPVDGADDPVWPNAANNAFKRIAFGIIDYFLEEEREYTKKARAQGKDQRSIDSYVDRLWGKVTLYNCYQMFVQLAGKKIPNPTNEFNAKVKSGELENEIKDRLADRGISETDPLFESEKQQEYQTMIEDAKNKAEIWRDKPEADELTLFFNATDMLPNNSLRTMVGNANKSLESMGGAEKMLSSCDLLAS